MSSNLLDIQKHLHEVGRELVEECQSMNTWMRSSTVVTGVNIGSPCLRAAEDRRKGDSLSPETCLWIHGFGTPVKKSNRAQPKTQRTLLLRSNIKGHEILPVPHVQSVFNQRGRCPGDVA